MTIRRLEPAQQFVNRMVLLNRFHAPDETDYSDAHHKLGAVHRSFPETDVEAQAAYLIAAMSEAAPFAEANFRTAYDYVGDLLIHGGYDLEAGLRDQQELGHAVWDLLQEEGRQAAQDFLADWFKPRILATSY